MPLTGPGTNSFPGNGVIIIDETPIVGGTDGYVLYDNNGVVGVEAGGGGGTITEGTTPTSGFTDGYAITSSGGFVGQAQIRAILTGNLNLYVNAATGSDSYNGLSATYTGGVNGPWATLQHVFNYLEATYIFEAAFASVNIAAGSYVGFGITAVQGSGLIQLIGAGSTQVTITTGPNDGFFNTGECWSGYTFTGIVVAVDGVTFDVTGVALLPNISGINYGVPGNVFTFGNFFTQSTDIAFAGSIANNVYIATTAAVEFGALPIGAGTGITFPGGESCQSALAIGNGTQFEDQGTWAVSSGTLSCASGFIALNSNATYFNVDGGYSGTVSGKSFNITGNSSASSQAGPGQLGLKFFPGDTPGFCDPSSSYDGSPGGPLINSQTASYQLLDGDAGNVVEMNSASANNLTIPTNATTPFPINTRIDVVQTGAGTTTIVAAGGVTLHSAGGATNIAGQYSGATIYQRAANEWVLIGELA